MLDEMTPKIKAVQKMQDYIAAHQTEEINLSEMANTACYSPGDIFNTSYSGFVLYPNWCQIPK